MTGDAAILRSAMTGRTVADPRAALLLAAIALGGVIGQLVARGGMFTRHLWILDAQARPMLTDVTEVWSARRLDLQGAPLLADDAGVRTPPEVTAIGHGFQGFPGLLWLALSAQLPLFVAARLASLPYRAAFALQVPAGIALHGASLAAIVRRPPGALLASRCPHGPAAGGQRPAHHQAAVPASDHALAPGRPQLVRWSFTRKAAGHPAAAGLAAPCVFASDRVILAVPLAFLGRHRPFDRLDYGLLAGAALAVIAFLFVPAPSGLGQPAGLRRRGPARHRRAELRAGWRTWPAAGDGIQLVCALAQSGTRRCCGQCSGR